MLGRGDEERELGRRLRAERPKPSEEFVRRLSGQIEPARRARRVSAPRVALVAAATAVLALSLGVAGAIGSATGSIHVFGTSVLHLVQPATTRATSSGTVTANHSQSGQGVDPRTFSYRHFPPFMHQYAGKIPICFHGQIIYVTPLQWFWYFIHGAGPARSCFSPHR
jgi:hypothetical protein